ncbi:hypothetical protein KsCSTR_15010 [Candidatus Kuenenia stuttgartiensis]|uniref:Uncharacterized protein n=1 Tax=Kuenenia stuttgartiensis TaxID=174633 RepID=Q1Q1H1_KUEST|nr:hypothetical protein KsCSTR_15010 [Candidatus Kuenenia stuttgartiensis]CAJ73855.1 unknown protein [Candidatus Kuenenia stuttgartiensis]
MEGLQQVLHNSNRSQWQINFRSAKKLIVSLRRRLGKKYLLITLAPIASTGSSKIYHSF